MNYQIDRAEERRREQRRARNAKRKREKKRQEMLRKISRRFAIPAAGVFVAVLCVSMSVNAFKKPDVEKIAGETDEQDIVGEVIEGESLRTGSGQTEGIDNTESTAENTEVDEEEQTQAVMKTYTAEKAADTLQLGADISSEHAILIDLDTDTIVAEKDASAIINPASMTKILTVLVAAEHVTDLDDTFTITLEITDYSYVNDCSSVGFAENEVVTVRDLFYGTILPSGGDAAAALATYVAGSKEAFVDMMNEKIDELGLSETAHVTNCVGLYDEDHYCTVYDMAMILEAAIENDLCREVLSAHTYTTSATEQHPEGITISNWFLRRIEDKDTGGEVVCAKTGYVVQSGNCAASYGKDASGKEYICVTANASSGWNCIYDHVALYKQFAKE